MKSENFIHIKFEYDSALETKKDILASEIDLLRISQRLGEYKRLRMLELGIKEKMERKLIALKLDIGRLQNLLPEVKVPRLLQPKAKKEKHVIQEEQEKEEVVSEHVHEEEYSIESELQEIQRRLDSLQR